MHRIIICHYAYTVLLIALYNLFIFFFFIEIELILPQDNKIMLYNIFYIFSAYLKMRRR